jgi:hypothetical protein
MTTSLKAFIPKLAKALEMNPTALYERQRALIRGGLLETKAGHGPGSGVRLSPESVAMLVISVLATNSLVDVEAKTREGAELLGREGKTFAEVFAEMLGSEEAAAKCTAVHFHNTLRLAIIAHGDQQPPQPFMPPPAKRGPPMRLLVFMAIMQGELIQHIAKEIANAG